MTEKNSCCQPKIKKEKGFINGLIYGLLPHTFCILFIIFSVFGATSVTFFLKGFLLNKNFFYYLIALSFFFATLTAIIYLKKNGVLSFIGVKRSLSYLLILYGTTVGVNLLLFLVIFPATANFSLKKDSIKGVSANQSAITLQVDIPCSGHAPLISSELKKLNGVEEIKFRLPNFFDVYYNLQLTSEEKILNQSIFKTFKATLIK